MLILCKFLIAGKIKKVLLTGSNHYMFCFYRRPSSDPFLYIVVAVSLLAPISAGYTIGYSSPAIPQLKNDTILDDNSASWFGVGIPRLKQQKEGKNIFLFFGKHWNLLNWKIEQKIYIFNIEIVYSTVAGKPEH